MAPADDEGAREPAGQEAGLRTDQPRDEQGHREHAGEAEQAEILLAQEGPQELAAGQGGDQGVQAVQRPAEADHEHDQREAGGQAQEPAALEPGHRSAGAAPPEPRPHEEQRLPAERVEVPDPVRPGIGRQGDARIDLGGQPHPERDQEHAGRPVPKAEQGQGEGGQQHDVERQDVHVGRLELQGERFDHRHPRLVEEVGGLELLGVERLVEGVDGVRHRRHEDREEEHVGDVELPDPVPDAERRDQEALALHGAPVHHAGGVAGDQDEHLRRVGEHHRLERELRHDVVGDVVDKDREEGETPKHIEPQVAPAFRH
jgi:hypothetical protein